MRKYLRSKTLINSVIIAGAVMALNACSSHNNKPVMAQFKPQYCYQTTTINTDNNGTGNSTVSSKGVTECTENRNNKHFLAYSGMAKDCREHWYEIILDGKIVPQRGFVCQKLDGSWEIVGHPYN